MPTTYSDAAIRHELLEQLASARQRTDDLFAIVSPGFALRTPYS